MERGDRGAGDRWITPGQHLSGTQGHHHLRGTLVLPVRPGCPNRQMVVSHTLAVQREVLQITEAAPIR